MTMTEIEFKGSFPNLKSCPADQKPEFAFIGRSNVGKSSLINMLTNRKSLAKVSVTPGKTQLLNFFEINGKWHLVDLPGYGYARQSKQKRASFSTMIRSYLGHRSSLAVAFVLIDSRHELQKIDREFLQWCGSAQVPVAIVFTKADKLSQLQLQSNISAIQKALLEDWETLPDFFISSSESRQGREEILLYIQRVIEVYSNSLQDV